MLRHRALAAAPVRDTSETWQALSALVAETLARSTEIDATEVALALQGAAGVGRILIAAGHLEEHPVSVLAGTMHLQITTVSGAAATTLEENPNPVPGCAGASDWTIYLPEVEPLGELIRSAASQHPHLSAAEPPQAGSEPTGSKTSLLDEDALSNWAKERR